MLPKKHLTEKTLDANHKIVFHIKMQRNQKKVLLAAKKRLANEKWFSGICVKNFPEESDCLKNFEDCVSQVCFETAMWDDPNFLDK